LLRDGNFRTFSYPDFKRFIQILKHHEKNMRKQASKPLIALALMLCSGYACSSLDNNGDDNEPYRTYQAKE
jgi:hypothetical protein